MAKKKNQKTRSPNIRRFYELQPELCGLADSLDLRLFWRDSVLWADDIQLSFPYEGVQMKPCSEERQAEIAMVRLRLIQDARAKWGTKQERANAIIDEFNERIAKPYKLRRMHFSVAQNDSLDSCSTFGGGYFPEEGSRVTLRLVGETDIEGRGDNLAAAVDDLRRKASEAYGSAKAE